MQRNCEAGPSVVHDELDAFHAMSKETVRVDRSLLQQSENLQRLTKTTDRYAAKLEKLKTQSAHLDDQLKFALITNKSIKENLKGKRQSKQTMEALVSNLERQLYLEEIDIQNKVKGFEQTQEKYDSMWKKYEEVYKKMPYMAKKEKAEKELEEIKLKAEKINKETEIIKAEADAIERDTEQKWCEVALLLAKHDRNLKIQETYDALVRQRDELRDEVQMLQIELEKAEIVSKRDESHEKNKIGKLRNMIGTMDLKDKQKFECLEISDAQQSNEEESESEASDTEKNDFDSLFEIENDFEAAVSTSDIQFPQDLKTSSPKESRKQQSQPTQKRKASSPLTPRSPVITVSQMQPVEPEPAILVKVVEIEASQIMRSVLKEVETCEQVELEELPEETAVAPSQQDELEPIIEEPAAAVVAVVEETAPITPAEENFCSQMTEVPKDLQLEQQEVLEETNPVFNVPESQNLDGKDGDACSQGTVSTTASSLVNLLDDDKRKEYMRRLMSSPNLTVRNDEAPAATAPRSPVASSAVSDNGYLQNFFRTLNQGGVAAPTRPADAMSTQKSSNTDAQSVASFVLDQNLQGAKTGGDFAFPTLSSQTDFAGFGSGASGMFSAAAPGGEAAAGFFNFGNNTSAPQQQQQPSGFSFNFGDQPQNSSFMNLF
ncbi:Hypothetical predicted protein [Cloeon dipterum]|uniref:Uncharacterized protein n=1 Tax=Cloeon dipterum TaxID=197152 RepID=A0A8S1E114_9INSE|nr:Hypothetical predicted protein [Cloeon dipterum]